MIKIPEQTLVYQLGTNIRFCSDYLYGYCHLFALSVKKTLLSDCNILLLWQHEKEDCSDFGFLAHAFLDIGSDRFIDCRGVVDMKTIESEYVENEKLSYIITDKTGSIINEYINSEYFHPFEKNEENQLINFIYQNKEAYCFFKK